MFLFCLDKYTGYSQTAEPLGGNGLHWGKIPKGVIYITDVCIRIRLTGHPLKSKNRGPKEYSGLKMITV